MATHPDLPARRTGGAMAKPEEQTRSAQRVAADLVRGRRRALQAILDKTIGIDRFEQIVFDVFRATPNLAKCSPESIVGGALEAAKAQLVPNTAAGYCWIVALNKWNPHTRSKAWQAEFWLGYQGAKVLATRDGRVIRVWGRVVHENDPRFEVIEGSEPRLEHVPLVVTNSASGRLAVELVTQDEKTIDPRGPLVAAYACARYGRGGTHFHVCAAADIAPIEAAVLGRQNNPSDSPWKTQRPAMWSKTAIKRLAKRDLQLPDAAHRPFELDGLAEAGKDQALHVGFEQLDRGEGKLHQVPAALELDEPRPNGPEDVGGYRDAGGWTGSEVQPDDDVPAEVRDVRAAVDAAWPEDDEGA